MSNRNPRIIIDASYIRGMSSNGAPFRIMREQGARIVLIDTLVYELCSTSNCAQWPASMNKLKAGVNAIEVWEHVSPMCKFELEQNRPYGDLLDVERTERMQEMIKNNSHYQPSDMRKLIKDFIKEREGNEIVELFQDFANWQPSADEIRHKAGDAEEVIKVCYYVVNNPDIIRLKAIGAIRQMMQKDGLDVLLNPDDVDDTWVIWHFGKSFLVLFCESQRRGADALKNGGKKLEDRLKNAKHDSDYLTLLAFADGIASCETEGEMSYWRKWMYGDTKPRLGCFDRDEIVRFVNDLKRGST